MKIRTKLLAGILPFALLAIGISVYVLYSRATAVVRGQSLNHLTSMAALQSSRIEAIIDRNRERLSLVTSRTKLRNRLAAYLDGADESAPASIRQILVDARHSIGDFRAITVSRLDGRVVASTSSPAPAEIRSPAAAREAVLGESVPRLVPYRADDGSIMLRLLGTLRLRGRVLGLVEIEATAATLEAAVSDFTGLGQSGETLVVAVDDAGHPIFVTPPRTRPGAAMTPIPTNEDRAPPAIRALREESTFELAAEDYRGVPVFAAGRHLDNLDWTVIVKMDQDEVLAPVFTLYRSVLIILIVATLALVALTAVTSSLITRRLTALTTSADRLTQGELAHRAADTGGDEIATLARGFNELAGAVETSMAEIERRNTALQRKNAELERFTYSVSHDLKSPLVTIAGFVELVQGDMEAGDKDRARRDLDRIGAAAARMGAALDDVLALSRVGRVANPPVLIEWHAVVTEAVNRLQGLITATDAEVTVSPDLGSVTADPDRLIEVSQNLIGNAIKFARTDAPPRVRVSRRERDGAPYLAFSDNGIGIDERHRDRVFELFERLNPDKPGTGLGLALVRRIVEFYGGDVWIEGNDADPGTTVCLHIPAEQPA